MKLGPLAVVALLAATASADPGGGFTAAVGGGTNVGTPFVEAQLGRRFHRAPFLEIFLDYSYDRPISELSFQTFGGGVRTYFTRFDRFELFFQAVAAFGVSSSGTGPVQNRAIGERLLGAFMTQGIGISAQLHRCWTASFTVSTGYPVYLRPELAVRYTF
jgi:hypothetical protein